MLKKENCLRKTKEIENVFRSGKSFYDETIGVKIIKNNLNKNRFCVIISAKVSKKSVDRNKIKRRIKFIIINLQPHLKQGSDCLIIVNKNISKNDFVDVKSSVQYIFKKVNFYK